MEKDINQIVKENLGSYPAQIFEEYFKERIPEIDREGTINVLSNTIDILKKTHNLPKKSSMYSLVFDLINYSYGEWWFAVRDTSDRQTIANNHSLIAKLSKKVALKFLLLVRGSRKGQLKISTLSPYSPINTALKALITELINLNFPFVKNNPSETLINDLFGRIFNKSNGTLKMLSQGLASDAYVSWRTLHEAECILAILVRDGKPMQDEYVKHIIYDNAFRGSIPSKEKTDEIFEALKTDMKSHGLKSKDMKKFIEYGWLYQTPEYLTLAEKGNLFEKYAVPIRSPSGKEGVFKIVRGPSVGDPDYPLFEKHRPELMTWEHNHLHDFKLNFRDGIEFLAGLSKYSEWYETASEVTHSSPVFFYSNDQFFFDLSTVALYQLVLRVTSIFMSYMNEVFKANPNTLALVEELISFAKEMCIDQCNRFKKLYGIDVLNDEGSVKATVTQDADASGEQTGDNGEAFDNLGDSIENKN